MPQVNQAEVDRARASAAMREMEGERGMNAMLAENDKARAFAAEMTQKQMAFSFVMQARGEISQLRSEQGATQSLVLQSMFRSAGRPEVGDIDLSHLLSYNPANGGFAGQAQELASYFQNSLNPNAQTADPGLPPGDFGFPGAAAQSAGAVSPTPDLGMGGMSMGSMSLDMGSSQPNASTKQEEENSLYFPPEYI